MTAATKTGKAAQQQDATKQTGDSANSEQNEIVQQLQRQKAQCEDHLLEALVEVEAATEKQQALQGELARLTADWEATRTRLRAEQAKLAAQLPVAQARQAAARRATPAALLPLYDSLRGRRAGRAVAEVDGEICTVCKVAVSPSKLEAARYGEELVYCDNCGRLLWGE
jgi:predicted  nucleic acid-binding Zn-ribbon protein